MKTSHVVLLSAALLVGSFLGVVYLRQSGARDVQLREEALRPSATGEESHDGREDHSEGLVKLSADQLAEFGVETGIAGAGTLKVELILTGDVALNADRIAHVVPRVSGVVREVRKNLGDTVQRGEVMAVMESRELADATAEILAGRERIALAQSNYNREELLWRKRLSSEQEYIQAKNALAEANIEVRTAEQKLRALGFSPAYIAGLLEHGGEEPIRYEMTAPFDGTVIEKHISLGEVLKDETTAFLVADLSSVWINLDVHQRDLPYIRIGQQATISVGEADEGARGRVSFIEPMAQETPRTVHARVVLPNRDARWRPGLFVTGRIAADDIRVPVLVPKEALVMVDGKMCAFLQEGDAFRSAPVSMGRTDETHAEITAGINPGQAFVVKGAFTLKSELEKPLGEEH